MFAKAKRAVGIDGWQSGNRNGALEIRAALENRGILISGVSLFLRCRKDRPDEMVSIGLTIETSYGPKCFARVDWRQAPHVNQSALCGHLLHVDAGRTHIHRPDLYGETVEPIEYLKQNLPAAVSLDPVPGSFGDLLDTAGTLLNVDNLTEVQTPPWEPRLFI